MIGWFFFAVTLTVAIALAVILRQRHEADLQKLQTQASAQLEDLRKDAHGRVDRLEREATRRQRDVGDKLVGDLLPALDALDAARAQVSDGEVAKGLQMVHTEFLRALKRHEVEPIAPQHGDAFDPTAHEAVEVLGATADLPPGHIARCHRIGYRSGAKVLRPALVGVTRGAANSEEE